MTFYIFRKNCRVKISFYFFAFLCAAALADRSGIMLCGLLAAMLHESGHIALMLLIPGQSPDEIDLTPFGVRIKNSPLSEFGRGNAWVLAAGSGANFLCAAATFGFLPRFAAVSLVLGGMNLLPVEGMDGGGILRMLLERRLSGAAADRALKAVSWVTLCLMAAAGICVLTATGYNFTLLGAAGALAAVKVKKAFKKCRR